MVFGMFGIVWVMPQSILALVECRTGWFGWHQKADIWGALPLCIMRLIWRERNNHTFERHQVFTLGSETVTSSHSF